MSEKEETAVQEPTDEDRRLLEAFGGLRDEVRLQQSISTLRDALTRRDSHPHNQ